MSDARPVAPQREEIVNTIQDTGFGIVEKPLAVWERLLDNGVFRNSLMLIALAVIW